MSKRIISCIAGVVSLLVPSGTWAAESPSRMTCGDQRVLVVTIQDVDSGGETSITAGNAAGDASDTKCGPRWYSERGDLIRVVVADTSGVCPSDIAIGIEETKRVPQWQSDLRALGKLIPKLRGAESAAPPTICVEKERVLENRYGEVLITISLGGKTLSPVKIVTGPPERWSLSANVVLNDIEEVQFNDSSSALETKDTPQEFLVGLDFWFPELGTPSKTRLGLKLMVEASRRPSSTIGLALTLRGNLWGLDTTTISPFIGAVRIRNDEVVDGAARRDSRASIELAAGLSFNLAKALEWIGSSTNKADE
jgi:hypothetical protein